MDQEELINNEYVEKILSPHPLSFMKLQALCIFLIVWGIVVGWIAHFSTYKEFFIANSWGILVIWGIVILLTGIIIALGTVQWNIFFLYLGVVLGGIALVFGPGWQTQSNLVIPIYSICSSFAGFLIVELYRRRHRYIITNLRVIFKGGILTKQERTIRYDKISDISSKQGILGQIFGFGTITPISQGGFGLGSDKALAAAGLEVGGKKGRVKGLGIVGGGKEVQVPRARSYYELHGVYPYKEIKKLIENLTQSTVTTPYHKEQIEYQKQQLDIQKQMRDLLKVRTKMTEDMPAVTAEQMEEEEQESEHVDIQKQMKDLLKKQSMLKGDQNDDEEPSEEEQK